MESADTTTRAESTTQAFEVRAPGAWVLAFLTPILTALLLWAMIPPSLRANTNTDYLNYYEPIAQRILAGDGVTYANGQPAVRYPPGYPVLLAGVFGLAEWLDVPKDLVLDLFALLCVGLTSSLLYQIARTVWRGSHALIPSLVWSVYPIALWVTKQPNSELPFIPILVASVALLWHVVRRPEPSRRLLFAVGVLAGAAMLLRPIALGLGFALCAGLWYARHGRGTRQRLGLAGMLLLGNLAAIAPWELWVYARTGEVITLSTATVPALRDGLTFAVGDRPYREGISVSPEVETVMENVYRQYGELQTTRDVASVLAAELQERPLGVVELFALKLQRSWYGTYTQRFETTILLLQVLYIGLVLWATVLAWRLGGWVRVLALLCWTVVLYFWGMSLIGLPLVRYMAPAISLLFLLLPTLLAASGRVVIRAPAATSH